MSNLQGQQRRDALVSGMGIATPTYVGSGATTAPAQQQQAAQPYMGTPAAAPQIQQSQNPNVFNQAAGAYTGALSAAQKALKTAGNYSAATASMGPSAVGGGYTAQQMAPVDNVSAGQFAGMDIAPYMNPYLNNVVDRTSADMERSRLIQQNQADDAMQAAGAFGGSRHGIANSETNRNYYDMLGNTLGDLRNTGYQNAQAAAFQDIGNRMQADFANQQSGLQQGMFNTGAQNEAARVRAQNAANASIANSQMGTSVNIANAASRNAIAQAKSRDALAGAALMGNLSTTGMNLGMSANGMQSAAGAQAQALQQQLMNAAQGQWQGYTNAGYQGLAALQGGISSVPNPRVDTSSSTSNPGIAGVLGGLASF